MTDFKPLTIVHLAHRLRPGSCTAYVVLAERMRLDIANPTTKSATGWGRQINGVILWNIPESRLAWTTAEVVSEELVWHLGSECPNA